MGADVAFIKVHSTHTNINNTQCRVYAPSSHSTLEIFCGTSLVLGKMANSFVVKTSFSFSLSHYIYFQ